MESEDQGMIALHDEISQTTTLGQGIDLANPSEIEVGTSDWDDSNPLTIRHPPATSWFDRFTFVYTSSEVMNIEILEDVEWESPFDQLEQQHDANRKLEDLLEHLKGLLKV